jgi:preprotein translocase subunit SecG
MVRKNTILSAVNVIKNGIINNFQKRFIVMVLTSKRVDKTMKKLTCVLAILWIWVLFTIPQSFAHETSVFPINDEIALEKTILIMDVPNDNQLPWAFVEGKIKNPAENYPVIIQFLKNDELVHVAQVEVENDGTYEYKFRVKTADEGRIINIFEGDYTIKIFKVVTQL